MESNIENNRALLLHDEDGDTNIMLRVDGLTDDEANLNSVPLYQEILCVHGGAHAIAQIHIDRREDGSIESLTFFGVEKAIYALKAGVEVTTHILYSPAPEDNYFTYVPQSAKS